MRTRDLLSLRPRASQRRRPRALAAGLMASSCLALAGCGTTTQATGVVQYWLVKVQGNYANIYSYSVGSFPGTKSAVNLGATRQDVRSRLPTAARRLGVPLSHIADESK